MNPLVDFVVTNDGDVTFANAAVDVGATATRSSYVIEVGRFDNSSGSSAPIGAPQAVGETRFALPAEARALRPGDYLELRVSTTNQEFPAWKTPVVVHLRRTVSGWDTAGLERLP